MERMSALEKAREWFHAAGKKPASVFGWWRWWRQRTGGIPPPGGIGGDGSDELPHFVFDQLASHQRRAWLFRTEGTAIDAAIHAAARAVEMGWVLHKPDGSALTGLAARARKS
jgi:hypothetical protein